MTSLLFAILALHPSAHGSVILGNPTSSVVVVGGDNVYIDRIVAYRCGSGYQVIQVDVVLDKNESEVITFDADEFCSIDVDLEWNGGGPETVPVGDFTSVKFVGGAGAVEIELDVATETATLQ